jgi:hypothetical protein
MTESEIENRIQRWVWRMPYALATVSLLLASVAYYAGASGLEMLGYMGITLMSISLAVDLWWRRKKP